MAVERRLQTTSRIADFEYKNGRGPGFEPGASRSRTVRPEMRLQGRIESAKALVTFGIGLLPATFRFDHIAHAHARLHSRMRIAEDASSHPSQQRRAER